MTDKSIVMRHVSRYISLTEAEQALLFSKVKFKHYKKGAYVHHAGEVCKYIYYVVSGCLKTFYADDTAKEYTLMFAIENWWTGDLHSFLTQTPADFNMQCLEDTRLMLIPHEQMEDLYANIPSLERFFRILMQNSMLAAHKRIVDNLRLSGREKYYQFLEKYPAIERRVPQYMIASYLGVTPEFLSKVRKKLRDE